MRIVLSALMISFGLSSVAGLETIPIYSTGSFGLVGDHDLNYITAYSLFHGSLGYSYPNIVNNTYGWADVSNLPTHTQWISSYPEIVPNPDPLYAWYLIYSTSFDSSPYALNTIKINGSWASSSYGYIYVNQELLQINGSGWNPTPVKDFTIPWAMLRPQNNTIDFIVWGKADIPNGVAVSISGTAESVPEPRSIILILIALAIGLGGRRCLQKTTQE